MVVYCIDESQANICVVVGHEHNVKELVALRVQLPQSGVYSLQGLQEITKTNTHTKKNRSQLIQIFQGSQGFKGNISNMKWNNSRTVV